MPEISVIVPVYKTEKYLSMCIESILSQSFSDFELILADDCSPDYCPQICDEYAHKDSRIRVLHLPHAGVSIARNAALDVSVGKYVVFCDSDDYVDQNYLKDMIEKQRNDTEAFVITRYRTFSHEESNCNEIQSNQKESQDEKIIDLDSMSESDYQAFVCGYKLWGPYCKLYRKELIDKVNLRFDGELQSAEDFDFNIKYLRLIKRLYYIPVDNYNYRVAWKSSVMTFINMSAIKSAHIIFYGMKEIAIRANLYNNETVRFAIEKMTAEKFYFGRLPMIFTRKQKVSLKKRKCMFNLLCKSDDNTEYIEACKAGIKYLPMNLIMKKVSEINKFGVWLVFYWAYDVFKGHDKGVK